MIVIALGLEEDGDVPHVSPEVSDRVSAVTSTRLGLQHAGAAGGGARLAELLPPGLITDRRPYRHLNLSNKVSLEIHTTK